MNSYTKHLLAVAAGLASLLLPRLASADIDLLQPIGAAATIPTDGPPFNTFFTYFNLIYPWALGTSAGIAVLVSLWGATGIILRGADQGERSKNIALIKGAIVGLLVLMLAGTILHTLNPSFYQI